MDDHRKGKNMDSFRLYDMDPEKCSYDGYIRHHQHIGKYSSHPPLAVAMLKDAAGGVVERKAYADKSFSSIKCRVASGGKHELPVPE